jgi:hypothetical protein
VDLTEHSEQNGHGDREDSPSDDFRHETATNSSGSSENESVKRKKGGPRPKWVPLEIEQAKLRGNVTNPPNSLCDPPNMVIVEST